MDVLVDKTEEKQAEEIETSTQKKKEAFNKVYDLESETFKNPKTGEPVVFKINTRMLISHLRAESFSSKVRDRLGLLQGLIIKSMLEKSNLHGKSLHIGHSEPLSIQEIISLLPSGADNRSVDYNKMAGILDQMCLDQ